MSGIFRLAILFCRLTIILIFFLFLPFFSIGLLHSFLLRGTTNFYTLYLRSPFLRLFAR